VSYNVLSSSLAGPNHFQHCDPAHLKEDARFPLVCDKLDEECVKGSIIVLQECSHLWTGKLHCFFAERGYQLITACYGRWFNGFMGVAIAVPTDKYNLLDVNIRRVSEGLWLPSPKLGFFGKLWASIVAFFLGWLIYLKLYKKPFDVWGESKYKGNDLISVLVEPRVGKSHKETPGKRFWVSTYHMPCAFLHPNLMVVHSALALQHIQNLSKIMPAAAPAPADADDEHVPAPEPTYTPYVFLGDFNFKPGDACYDLYQVGKLDKAHPDRPNPLPGMKFVPEVKPVRSAYLELLGSEPEFTNNAHVKKEQPFIETLDYIFISDEWDVTTVINLPSKDSLDGPYPDAYEPSDHLMIGAELTFNPKLD
jgi:hypothetical protein